MSKKSPQLRFEGFTDDWEERKLGDIGDTFTGLTGKTKEDFGHGSAKFVTYVNVFQNPIATLDQLEVVEIDEKQNQVQKGDVFFTTSSETPEEVGMSSVWTHDTKNVYLNSFTFGYRPRVSFDLNYMASMLRSPSIRKKITFLAQGISRYNISKTKMLEIEIPTPNLSEQQKIGAFFKKIDDTIALHQRKLDLLKEQKKGYLQKMFPKNGEKVPELRFAGFADDWEERKLKDIAQFNPKTVLPDEFEYVDLESVVGTEMISHRTESKDQAPSRAQRLAQKGDVFYQTVRPYQMNNYLYDLPYDNYVFSTGYAQMRPNIDSYFLLNSVQNKQFVQHVLDRSTGTSYPAINSSDLSNIEIHVPSKLSEQQKIGAFFQSIDDTITLHQRKLDLLKEQKKGFLQKMFV
ncbi:restriction endonuclease subunit S [Lactococcus petauri]|uniref:restriction endonuclease subunit S n=1 Tax=Lactococcus petauri TaxID=1940789 RepID=UPI0038555E09